MFRHNKPFTSVRNLTCSLALLAAFIGHASPALAQNPGTFTATGSTTVPRAGHTATLLPNGKVLFAGGYGTGDTLLSSAELYDPSSGTFAATGDMITARGNHAATLLPDGRVLITGGNAAGVTVATSLNFFGLLPSAELYNPSSGTFTSTGYMLNARGGHAAILLTNGKVLIVGGTIPYYSVNAELYDPASGTFGATGEYLTDGACDASAPAVPLADGTVLFAQKDISQVYYPINGAFIFAGAPFDCLSAAAPLANGKVLFAGGEVLNENFSTHAKLYDPATGAFASTGNLAWPRFEHTLTALPDGTALAAGGETGTCSGSMCILAGTLSNAELYDPSKGAFAPAGNMTTPRSGHTATLLKDGSVLLAGGDSYGVVDCPMGPKACVGFFGTTSAELYCPANANCSLDSWQQAIAVMKTAAGTDSLNFYQWAWYWQTAPAFVGAPSGFGAGFGSISPDLFTFQIVAAGGGDPLLNVSAEQWVGYFRQAVPK